MDALKEMFKDSVLSFTQYTSLLSLSYSNPLTLLKGRILGILSATKVRMNVSRESRDDHISIKMRCYYLIIIIIIIMKTSSSSSHNKSNNIARVIFWVPTFISLFYMPYFPTKAWGSLQ